MTEGEKTSSVFTINGSTGKTFIYTTDKWLRSRLQTAGDSYNWERVSLILHVNSSDIGMVDYTKSLGEHSNHNSPYFYETIIRSQYL